MEKDKVLKSMTAYIDNLHELFITGHIDYVDFYNRATDFKDFISQPPQLCDFVPCDKDGKPIEEPNPKDYFNVSITTDQFTEDDKKGLDEFSNKLMEWEDALNRCIFVGWEIKDDESRKMGKFKILSKNGETIATCFPHNKEWIFWKDKHNLADTYEQIISSGIELELTENKAKELNLI